MRRIGIIIGLAAATASPAMAQTANGIPPAVVYFAEAEAGLTYSGVASLTETAQAYRRAGPFDLVVSGHTATFGDAAANVSLSQRRAGIVRDQLIAQGVPAAMISTQAFGEQRPTVDTPDNTRELRNDRVEVFASPASAW